MADKEKKAKKPKKEAKKFPAKKMPGMFKKSYSEKKLEKKVLNRLYVPSDKKEVMALFEKGANAKKPELMAMSRERQFTKAELKHFKSLSKQIKAAFQFCTICRRCRYHRWCRCHRYGVQESDRKESSCFCL